MFPRTRFKKEIVCEFLLPAVVRHGKLRRGKPSRLSQKVIILCSGMPSVPKNDAVMEFWSKRGFWVFCPRYRGTWESGGEFLKHSPHEDILDIIDELPKGFTELWSGEKYKVRPSELYIFGGSFGGSAAILSSRDARVTKAVAISPVIDWQAPSKDEPMDKLGAFLPKGFGNAYRFSPKNWTRLSRGEFYNPIDEADSIDGSKLLVFHAKDDRIVPYPPTKKFAQKTGAKLITIKRGGHFGISESTLPKFYTSIKKFLNL